MLNIGQRGKKMGRLIIILLIAFGAVYIYTNQEDLINEFKQYVKIDRKIYQLKNIKNKQYKFFGEDILLK